MRRIMLAAALALTVGASSAHAVVGVGVEVFGGVSVPILNDLSEQGTQFGFRVPVAVTPMIVIEPYYSQSGLGEVEESFGGPVTYTRDGGDMTSFGANVLFSFGGTARFYPFAGLGRYTLEREGSEDVEDIGYNFGLGFAFDIPGLTGLGADLRGEFAMVKTDETSQKYGNVTAGLKYNFFKVP